MFIGANLTVLYDVQIDNSVIIWGWKRDNERYLVGLCCADVPCRIIGCFEDQQKNAEIMKHAEQHKQFLNCADLMNTE